MWHEKYLTKCSHNRLFSEMHQTQINFQHEMQWQQWSNGLVAAEITQTQSCQHALTYTQCSLSSRVCAHTHTQR